MYLIIYEIDKTPIKRQFKQKKDALYYYIELLKTPYDADITNLKILKGDEDITIKVNKFLYN